MEDEEGHQQRNFTALFTCSPSSRHVFQISSNLSMRRDTSGSIFLFEFERRIHIRKLVILSGFRTFWTSSPPNGRNRSTFAACDVVAFGSPLSWPSAKQEILRHILRSFLWGNSDNKGDHFSSANQVRNQPHSLSNLTNHIVCATITYSVHKTR